MNCNRVNDREYLSTKKICFINKQDNQNLLIEILKKSFKEINFVNNIDDVITIYKDVDCFICYENNNSLDLISKLREYNNYIPFIILENDNNKNNPFIYLKYNLSQYIHKNISNVELIFYIEHELKNYDNYLNNKKLNIEHRLYLELLNKNVIVSKTDLKGKIIYVNDIFCEVSGYSKEELIGKQHNIVRHHEMSSEVFKNLWETIKKNETWEGIIKNKNKNGDTYITKATISPFYDNKNNKIGYVGIRYVITDEITEKKNLKNVISKTLVEKHNSIKEKDKEIDDLNKKIRRMEIMSDDFYKDAFDSSEKRRLKIQKQVDTYEDKIKDLNMEHENKVEKYLDEKRNNDRIISEKNRSISLLEDKNIKQSIQIKDLNNIIHDLKVDIDTLKKSLRVTNDLLKHREEQLEKLK